MARDDDLRMSTAPGTRTPPPIRTQQDRIFGLRRIKRLTRWSLAGALAGTGLFAGLAAQAGTTTSAAAKTTSAVATTSGSTASTATASTSSGTSSTDDSTTQATTTTTTPTVSASDSTATVTSGAS